MVIVLKKRGKNSKMKMVISSKNTNKYAKEERKRQRLTQQELSDITGVRTSNIARFEGGTRIPTLLMLEKYANALGKHIEVSIRDKE